MGKKSALDKVKSIQRVLGSRVVLRRLDKGELSEGGIVIPDSVQENGRLAEVVSVGNVTKWDLKPGDVVLTTKFRGSDIIVNGEELVVMDEADMWMVVGV